MSESPHLTTPSHVSRLLAEYGLRTDRRHGQHFLADRNILLASITASGLQPDEGVLEIGAGIGTLTVELAGHAAQVLTFEIDHRLLPVLHAQIDGSPSVRLVEQDFLRADLAVLLPDTFGSRPWRVVANIPYNITAPILQRLFTDTAGWRCAVLMVQREVAERLTAEPGSDIAGAITIFAHYHIRPELIRRVPASVFYPPPRVESALIRLTPIPPALPAADEARMFRIVHAVFQQRRKTLSNALTQLFGADRTRIDQCITAAGIDPSLRGERLTLSQFMELAQHTADFNTSL